MSPGVTGFGGFNVAPSFSRSLAAAFAAVAGAAFAGAARNVASGARLDRRIEARFLTGYQPARELSCRGPARDGYQRRIASHWLRGPLKTGGKGKAGTVATVATVDQFIRHAESGFFGDDEEADCPFVWDGDC